MIGQKGDYLPWKKQPDGLRKIYQAFFYIYLLSTFIVSRIPSEMALFQLFYLIEKLGLNVSIFFNEFSYSHINPTL